MIQFSHLATPAEFLPSFPQTSHQQIKMAQVEMGFRVLRVQNYGPFIAGDGLVQPSKPPERTAHLVVGEGVIGLLGQGFLKTK